MASSSAGYSIPINNIDQLPDEIMLYIFELLPVESVLTCEQVSERWKALARDPYTWRRIIIVYSGREGAGVVNTHRAMEIITSHCDFLCNLRLTYVDDTSFVNHILSICQKANMITLELWMCRINQDIKNILKDWRNLKKLSIKNCLLAGPLKTIDIPYDQYENLICFELSEFGLNNNSCDTLIKLRHLKYIRIDKIQDLDKQNMIKLIMSKIEVIEMLHIYGKHQVDDDVLIMLSTCPKLKSLSIKYCNELTDRGLISLINLKTVQSLQLWNNTTFTDKCLLTVLGNPVMFQMVFLSLSRVENVTDPIFDIVCDNYTKLSMIALYKCPRLNITTKEEDRIKNKFGNINVILH